jgi:hypothetical protein
MSALPVAITVTRHRCPFCPRSWSKRPAAVAHIGRCWKNPANRSCKTCVHFQEERVSSDQCIPGRDCGCNSWPEACTHQGGPEELAGPVTGCSLWQGRPGYRVPAAPSDVDARQDAQ